MCFTCTVWWRQTRWEGAKSDVKTGYFCEGCRMRAAVVRPVISGEGVRTRETSQSHWYAIRERWESLHFMRAHTHVNTNVHTWTQHCIDFVPRCLSAKLKRPAKAAHVAPRGLHYHRWTANHPSLPSLPPLSPSYTCPLIKEANNEPGSFVYVCISIIE